jgi:aquaporin Z
MKKIIAETFSTFCLVFLGTGSVILNSVMDEKITLLGIALITGAVVSIMIIAVGKWSGAHMNPAVTLALATKGALNKTDILPYIIAQGIGAFAGSYLLKYIFQNPASLGETIPTVNFAAAFAIETILSFMLMATILFVSEKKIAAAPWIIGAVVALGIFLGGNYSGGSMNPIRSLSPAVVNNNLQSIGVFLSAPFAGMILAVVTLKFKKR